MKNSKNHVWVADTVCLVENPNIGFAVIIKIQDYDFFNIDLEKISNSRFSLVIKKIKFAKTKKEKVSEFIPWLLRPSHGQKWLAQVFLNNCLGLYKEISITGHRSIWKKQYKYRAKTSVKSA
jgi:hypothetical protein